jgi:hypothetical protein
VQRCPPFRWSGGRFILHGLDAPPPWEGGAPAPCRGRMCPGNGFPVGGFWNRAINTGIVRTFPDLSLTPSWGRFFALRAVKQDGGCH